MSNTEDAQRAQRAFFANIVGISENMPDTLTRHHDVYPAIDPRACFDNHTYQDKVVIITGASSGIGLDIATHYARAGASVTIVARNSRMLEDARASIEKATGSTRVLTVCADVTLPSDAEGAIKQTVERWGGIDILVANAGVGASYTIPLGEMDPLAWFEPFRIHVFGVYTFIRYAIEHLQKTKGYIVVITSGMSQLRMPNLSSYAISKHAVNRLVEFVAIGRVVCRRETRSLISKTEYPNIMSFSLHPGTIRTAINAAAPSLPAPDTTALAAATTLYLTSGKLDWLHGRYVSANWDVEELERDFKDKIIQQGSLVTKLAIPE
ncbi:NAD-P-binding protein [Peniophora sp. CONT]|nr:NAD-P-binding protein [Peniophora sp. CONT]